MKELKSRHDVTTKGLHNYQGINKTHPWYNIKLMLILTMILYFVACINLGTLGSPKGSHGRGPMEGEPLGAQGIPWEGSWTTLGGEPLGAKVIPWEGTLGTPHWEPSNYLIQVLSN